MISIEHSLVEQIKAGSGFLRGTVVEELSDGNPSFSKENVVVLKFHGITEEDNRDVRADLVAGASPEVIFMVRAAIPGGVLTADQYLALDRLADQVGNGTLRLTTRQAIQFHHARKTDLATLIQTLNQHLVTTLGASGDAVRNVMSCPAPLPDRAGVGLGAFAEQIADQFRPRTRAYYDIWMNGERAVTAATTDEEPFYGRTYLPRKFKIGLAFPQDNCIDVYSQDVGIVAHVRSGNLEGFTLLVGGGLGRTHGRPETFPRLADPLCFVAPEDLFEVLEGIVGLQKDFGDRLDRKQARLKYLIDHWGVDIFKDALEQRLGRRLAAPLSLAWTDADDHLGAHRQDDDRWFIGVPIEGGRIADRGDALLRTGLRIVTERFRPGIRLTPGQNLLLTDLTNREGADVVSTLEDHGVLPVGRIPPVVLHSVACPALPTCPLAVTESERILPEVTRALQAELDALGIGEESIRVRMTGCPNGCARPHIAEIAFVGRRKGRYDVHVGGSALGTRLNVLLAENVAREDLIHLLSPILVAYRDDRFDGETFGDFCLRSGVGSGEAADRGERPPMPIPDPIDLGEHQPSPIHGATLP
ncbi:MAG TPA: NADPH-dependent assimilatory sulfite reductase hemoprotein subunit [Actinobacteria bacterium]|nr:sulfite reductase [ferredoxin] [bacterium BMS3Bbin01]HDH25363.1 NADPH-dependent assimilatory sulfite reductase hemoprotein subunit [Actinomycetota bacterium]